MDIETVRRAHEAELMRLPHVIGVGLGLKDGKEVIKVLVDKKVSADSLRPQEIIPQTLDGFPTDVEEVGTITAQGG